MPFAEADLPINLNRVLALNGTDEGFYVLALHSLIEGYANNRSIYISTLDRFWEKMDALFHDLGLCDPETGAVPALAKRLTHEHAVTNRVRHDFRELSQEEARTATFNFLRFCEAVGWEHQLLDDFKEALKLWSGKKTPLEQYREMRKLRLEFNQLKEQKAEVEEEVGASRDTRATLEEVKTQLKLKDQELAKLKETASNRKEKSTQLRQRLRAAEEEKKELLERAERLQQAELYMSYLERFTAYTRSRADYERTVLQLSPEQKRAAERIGERGDYLVHGPAGTGKTFVLLHALDQELERQDQELGVTEHEQIALLTYTRTLVRFDEYLTRVVGSHRSKPAISTVDSFVLQACQ
ncbi:MAG: UvrD-helicase domain-containing protein, partial [Spirochaetaceae bacterium]